ncbi:hypothetical protein Plhal304r1_c001g0001981 [Plasmopara halstedii]
MLRRRMATLALPLMRSFSIKPVINVKSSKIHETIIVQNCGGKILRWIGPVSRFQMFCSILLSGSLVYQSDASALMMEVLATSGAICSASATVYFGAKRMCDKVVTDIMSCRKVGDPNEFVRVLVMGIGSTEVLEANPKDVKLLGYDGQDVYTFLVGGRQLQLDASTGEYVNRKALDMLMQGRPLVSRSKKPRKQRIVQLDKIVPRR